MFSNGKVLSSDSTPCLMILLSYFLFSSSNKKIAFSTAYDMSCHPSEQDKTRKMPHLPHEAQSMVGEGRHPLIYVPSLKTIISFTWKMLSPGHSLSYEHHSPYLMKPESKLTENRSMLSDKFALFRSDSVSVKVNFELSGSNECANWVALQIDVMPWFTHLNSTAIYSSQSDDKESEAFPKFQSVSIEASVNELKVATWFAGEEIGGVCLIVKRVNYAASVEGGKEIVIKGPVKAAILDLIEFNVTGGKMDCQNESSDMDGLEKMASEFGSPNYQTNSTEIQDHCSQSETSFSRHEIASSPYMKLQELSRDINELDYLFITDQIDIQNQSLERILAGSDESRKSENAGTMGIGGQSTWSILVSRLKLLWTIEIRDTLMAITQGEMEFKLKLFVDIFLSFVEFSDR